MSAAFFEGTFPIAGQPRIQDAGLIAALLQQASLVVPADELQKHLATLGHSGDYVLLGSDMEHLFNVLSLFIEQAAPLFHGLESSTAMNLNRYNRFMRLWKSVVLASGLAGAIVDARECSPIPCPAIYF